MYSHVCPDYDDPQIGPSNPSFLPGDDLNGMRHIMRIVLMIPIYAIISFLSFRFYKESIYYETIRDCYEAFVIYSFFILLLTYLGDDDETQRSKITGPDRRKLLYPLNCFYYNPLNENFLHYMKYGILQYVAIKPLCTFAAVVLQYYGLYCETVYDFHFGMIYITIINFISVSVALYCLVGVFKPENGWTIINVELGISSILICAEMVVFSILHVYSFSYRPYVIPGVTTSVIASLRDGFNPVDMIREIVWALQDTVHLLQGKPFPAHDGRLNLSFRLKRANTIRLRKRDRLFKIRIPVSLNTVDPKLAAIYQTSLESEHGQSSAAATAGHEDDVHAGLLAHADGHSYQSTSAV
ncbi:hypothetical protein BGX27_000682 [Mortierella sp. AM989]|nr:hypothetical protein BGX27_000682 [Mortierella sp. AM989]